MQLEPFVSVAGQLLVCVKLLVGVVRLIANGLVARLVRVIGCEAGERAHRGSCQTVRREVLGDLLAPVAAF
jgi:hypothetical protein